MNPWESVKLHIVLSGRCDRDFRRKYPQIIGVYILGAKNNVIVRTDDLDLDS